MDAKGRYRLQRKLRSALTRVVEVLAYFHEADLPLNVRNMFLAAGVADALRPYTDSLLSFGSRVPTDGDVDPRILQMMIAEVVRRRRQSERRRRKEAVQEMRQPE
jgi:hypothetical protein